MKEFLREGVDDGEMAKNLTTIGITLSGLLLDVDRVENSPSTLLAQISRSVSTSVGTIVRMLPLKSESEF